MGNFRTKTEALHAAAMDTEQAAGADLASLQAAMGPVGEPAVVFMKITANPMNEPTRTPGQRLP